MSSSLILYNNNEQFLDQIVTCDEKWILGDNQWQLSQRLDWKEALKHSLKPNLHLKRSWSLFGGLLPIWSATAFCIPAKPLHLRSVLSKLMRCTEKNGYTCSRHLILLHDNAWPCCTTNSSKVEWIGLRSFTSSATFTWPLANWLPLLQASRQLFAGKTLPQPAGGRKCCPRVHQIQNRKYWHYRNKQTYFLMAESIDCSGSYFD